MCPVCCNSEDEDDHLEVVGIFSSILSLWLRRGPELQRAGVNVETAQFSVQRRGNQLVVLQTHNRHEDVYFKRTQRKLNSNFVVQIMFPMGKKYSAQLHIKSRPASLCRVKYNYRDIHLLEKHFNRYVYICIRRMMCQTGFQSCFLSFGRWWSNSKQIYSCVWFILSCGVHYVLNGHWEDFRRWSAVNLSVRINEAPSHTHGLRVVDKRIGFIVTVTDIDEILHPVSSLLLNSASLK